MIPEMRMHLVAAASNPKSLLQLTGNALRVDVETLWFTTLFIFTTRREV